MHRPAGDAAVTVVIRSRAGDSPRLRESLYAVAALVRAEVRAVVIVDSTDPTHHREVLTAVERVRGLLNVEIRVAGGRPQTAARAFNVGLDAVATPYASFIEAGEILYPRHARLLVDALQSEPGAVAAFGGGWRSAGRWESSGFVVEAKTAFSADPLGRLEVLLGPGMALCAAVVDVNALHRLGIRFDEELPGLVDWAFLRRLACHGPFVAVEVLVCEHRLTAEDGPDWPYERIDADHELHEQALRRTDAEPVSMQAAELAALYEGHRKRLESEQHHSATAESALASLTAHAGLLARQVAALQARLGWSEGAGGVPRRGWWKRRAGVPLPPPAQPHPREGSRSHPGVSSDVGVPLEDRQR